MHLQYPDLAQQLGLSPAQAEALFDFLMRQQGDLNRIALAGGESGSQAIKEMQANQQHELEAFLGPSDYQKWQAYAPTLEARRRISELTSMVASSGEPITETQKQPLLDTILAEQQRRAQEEQMRAYPTTDRRAQLDTAMQDLKGREESYQRIQDSARNYLTPVQFETMKASMDRQIAMTRNALEQQLAQLENGR
jgi:hypothetical protein